MLVLLVGMTEVLSAQETDTIDASEYFVIGENPATAWVDMIGNVSFLISLLPEQKKSGGRNMQ